MADDVPNLRPHAPALVSVIGSLVGICGVAYAIVSHFATAPTRSEFEQTRNDVVQIRLDQAVMKGDVQRAREDSNEIRVHLEAIRKTLEQRKR